MDRRSSGRFSLNGSPIAESTHMPIHGVSMLSRQSIGNSSCSSISRGRVQKTVMSPTSKIDARVVSDVLSRGLASRIVQYNDNTNRRLIRAISATEAYTKPGQFPIVHMNSREQSYKSPKNKNLSMVRIPPPERAVFQTNTITGLLKSSSIVPSVSQSSSPLNGHHLNGNIHENQPIIHPLQINADLRPTKSVLEELKAISRKRISNNELGGTEITKKYKEIEVNDEADALGHKISCLQETPICQAQNLKRQRDNQISPPNSESSANTSPSEKQVVKKRLYTKNNEITSSLSSSLTLLSKKKTINNQLKDEGITVENIREPNKTDHIELPNVSALETWKISEEKELNSRNTATMVSKISNVETATEPQTRPKVTLFNKNYEDLEVKNIAFTDKSDYNIQFIKPKNTCFSSNKHFCKEKAEQMKLAMMLQGLKGEFNIIEDNNGTEEIGQKTSITKTCDTVIPESISKTTTITKPNSAPINKIENTDQMTTPSESAISSKILFSNEETKAIPNMPSDSTNDSTSEIRKNLNFENTTQMQASNLVGSTTKSILLPFGITSSVVNSLELASATPTTTSPKLSSKLSNFNSHTTTNSSNKILSSVSTSPVTQSNTSTILPSSQESNDISKLGLHEKIKPKKSEHFGSNNKLSTGFSLDTPKTDRQPPTFASNSSSVGFLSSGKSDSLMSSSATTLPTFDITEISTTFESSAPNFKSTPNVISSSFGTGTKSQASSNISTKIPSTFSFGFLPNTTTQSSGFCSTESTSSERFKFSNLVSSFKKPVENATSETTPNVKSFSFGGTNQTKTNTFPESSTFSAIKPFNFASSLETSASKPSVFSFTGANNADSSAKASFSPFNNNSDGSFGGKKSTTTSSSISSLGLDFGKTITTNVNKASFGDSSAGNEFGQTHTSTALNNGPFCFGGSSASLIHRNVSSSGTLTETNVSSDFGTQKNISTNIFGNISSGSLATSNITNNCGVPIFSNRAQTLPTEAAFDKCNEGLSSTTFMFGDSNSGVNINKDNDSKKGNLQAFSFGSSNQQCQSSASTSKPFQFGAGTATRNNINTAFNFSSGKGNIGLFGVNGQTGSSFLPNKSNSFNPGPNDRPIRKATRRMQK